MGARLALCLPLLMLATPSQLSAQVRDPWRDLLPSTQSPPMPATVASIALSMRSRPIQDSRCYLMNGGAVESFFISEDTPVGSVIGTLSVNGDPSLEGGDISLRVQEARAGVALAPGSKNLTLQRALDREERLGPSNLYVNVRCDRRRTTDPSFIIPVSVRVWDVNDNAPVWEGAPYHARVSELAAPGARLLAPRARDADQPGPHATLHYSVLPGPHSDLVKFAHELESVVVVARALDYEALRNFTVRLRAADAGVPPRHADADLTVSVLDADDHNPAFAHDHYSATLPQDPNKDPILVTSPGPVSAADQDLGINAPVAYSAAGDNRQLVRVDRDTGHVTVTDQLMAITQPVTIVLKATQVDNPDRYALATLGVSPRAAPAGAMGQDQGQGQGQGQGQAQGPGVRFLQREYDVSVPEDAAPGAVLATLHTVPENQQGLQFFVSERGFLGQFALDGGGRLLLRRALDHGARARYHYQVMVTDGHANDTASLNITVINVNEWEPRFRFPQYEFRVDSAGGRGQGQGGQEGGLLPVGKLDVFDGDKEDTVTLTLRGPDANMLYINPLGEMFVRSEALSAPSASVLRVLATASDSGHPPKQSSVPVVVHVRAAASEARGRAVLVTAGASLAVLAALVLAVLMLLRWRRKSKPSPASASKPYMSQEKTRTPPPPAPGSPPPPGGHAGGHSGSLQSVSAGASTILANSSSSLDLRDSLPSNGNAGGGRGARGKVAPQPPGTGAGPGQGQGQGAGQGQGTGEMSDHLAAGGGGAGRSGVAWPAATIPARVKKLSWDDAAHPQDSGVVEAANTARHDHMNLTVYF